MIGATGRTVNQTAITATGVTLLRSDRTIGIPAGRATFWKKSADAVGHQGIHTPDRAIVQTARSGTVAAIIAALGTGLAAFANRVTTNHGTSAAVNRTRSAIFADTAKCVSASGWTIQAVVGAAFASLTQPANTVAAAGCAGVTGHVGTGLVPHLGATLRTHRTNASLCAGIKATDGVIGLAARTRAKPAINAAGDTILSRLANAVAT